MRDRDIEEQRDTKKERDTQREGVREMGTESKNNKVRKGWEKEK